MDWDSICEACEKKYKSQSYHSFLCRDCDDLHTFLIDEGRMRSSWTTEKYHEMKELIYPDLELEVTYEVVDRSHDGSCLNPTNEKEKRYTTIDFYPLLRSFKQSDIGHSRTIRLDHPKLCFYKLVPSSMRVCCSETHSIRSARVVKKENVVDLLDL